MRTNFYVIAFIVLFTPISFTQISLVQHTIDGNFPGAASVQAADVNGDSLIDVICSGLAANSVALWKNDGNNPINWEKQTIASNFQTASSVFVTDMDNDGDNDVLGSAWMVDEIAWWRNDGGNPVQWTKQTIGENFDGAESVFATDIDDDGDVDVLGAAMNGNQIALWYNDGENPITWTKKVIDGNFRWARSVYAVDVNGDSLIDILGASYIDNTISIWYNGDDTTWTAQIVDNSFAGAHRVYASDLDNDNKIDVLGAAYLGDEIAWWKNNGGNPIQWEKHTIDDNFDGAISVYTCDIDADGDVDILGAAEFSGNVALWLNNDGSALIWTKQTISSNFAGAWGIYAEDIDNDDDLDVISAASVSNDITWWENDGVVNVENTREFSPKYNLEQNYPNPFNPTTTIQYSLSREDFVKIRIYDVLGNEIETLVNEEKPAGEYKVEFNVESSRNLSKSSGVYFYQLVAGNFVHTKKMILIK